MKQLLMGVALSTFCLAASACTPNIEYRFKPIPLPAERIDCVKTSKRPVIDTEYAINWSIVEKSPNIATAVSLARSEVARYVSSIRTREGQVTGYILAIEGELFACSSDAQWLRDYTSKIEK